MQRRKLINYLEQIKNALSSEFFSFLVKKKTLNLSEFNKFNGLILDSKSNFDSIIAIPDIRQIIEEIDGDSLTYKTENILATITALNKIVSQYRANKTVSGQHLIVSTNMQTRSFFEFHEKIYSFHNTLSALTPLDHREEIEITSFTIVRSDKIKLDDLNKILKLLDELISRISQYLEIEDPEVSIQLIESGSDVNMVLSGAKKVIGWMKKTFEDYWTFFVQRKIYVDQLNDRSFMDKLEILQEIENKIQSKAIDPERGKVMKEMIYRKIEDLHEQKFVLTEKIEGNNVPDNGEKLLDTFVEAKKLRSGDETEES